MTVAQGSRRRHDFRMPPLIIAAAAFGVILLFVAILPRLELWAGRRYADIVYLRLRRNGGRIDVWRGKPLERTVGEDFQWSVAAAPAFDRHGMPSDTDAAAAALRQQMRKRVARFPVAPIIVLHAIDRARSGLTAQDRRRLGHLGEELGSRVVIGDLPNAFPERAFHEIRANGVSSAP